MTDINQAFANLIASSGRGCEVFDTLKEMSIEAWEVAERRLSKPEFLALVDDFRLHNAGLITLGEVEESMILRGRCERRAI